MSAFEDLAGGRAVVTGSSGGIGGAVVARLCAAGVRVVGFDRTPPRADPVPGARHLGVDLADADAVERAWHEAARQLGGIDLLVNAAGVEGPVGPLAEVTLEQFDTVLAVNLRSVFVTTRLALRAFGDGPGAIVNVASIASLHGHATLPAYAVSKHGVLGLTRSAARQPSAPRVRVNAVCPGPIDTPMAASIEAGTAPGDPAAERARRERANPMRRYGRPDEVADAVLWLLSAASSYVNGACLTVDGGVMA